tara:strand:+ start:3554 stop:4543 length:990 start_codon:yes stop_codon:yes gene_type:complete
MNKIIGFDNEFEFILKKLENNKLNNSILITGNKGIGKFFFITKIIENYIRFIVRPDQINHHLNLLSNNSHPNIKILQKKIDEKTSKIKNNISIDQIREINHFLNETSFIEDLPKFILIDSADDLNLSSSNALLKILEEPKTNNYFFLISHQPSLLIPTIKSRCLKLKLSCHNFKNFEIILKNNNFSSDKELTKFLFDITGGSPGLSNDYNFNDIIKNFDLLINSIIDENYLSDLHQNISNLFSEFTNDKFKIHLSIIKFILIVLKKIKMGIDIKDNYLSKNILRIENFSKTITLEAIDNKFDYLIKNQNDLFTLNLDKKLFMINFFTIK